MKMLSEEEREVITVPPDGYEPASVAPIETTQLAFAMHACGRLKLVWVGDRRRLVPSEWGEKAVRVDNIIRGMT